MYLLRGNTIFYHLKLIKIGLFDNLFSTKSTAQQTLTYNPHSEHEAWVAILYTCMSVDGDVSDAEIDALARILVFKNKFQYVDIVPLYRSAAQGKMRVGFFSVIESSVALINEEDKPTLLALATEMVLSDGIITDKEKELIEFLAKQLTIDETLAAKIIEVILIKNKDNRLLI
jgi:uncharacterized tellurite resistance protein B-like protein